MTGQVGDQVGDVLAFRKDQDKGCLDSFEHLADLLLSVPVDDDRSAPGAIEHAPGPVGRKRRVQRDVAIAAVERAEDARDDGDRALTENSRQGGAIVRVCGFRTVVMSLEGGGQGGRSIVEVAVCV